MARMVPHDVVPAASQRAAEGDGKRHPPCLRLAALRACSGRAAGGRSRKASFPFRLTPPLLLLLLLSPGGLRAVTLDYRYDGRGNVISRGFDDAEGVFVYDRRDRLRGESGLGVTQVYGLDGNGNRLEDGRGVYSVTPASNRLATTPAGAVELDAAGYRLADAGHRYSWNAAGELAAVRSGAAHALAPETLLATYAYDYRHLRVLKTVDGTTTVFHHDAAGHLVAETRSTGEPLRSYVWLDGIPVAVIEHAALTGGAERTLYLETDALGTPRSATDESGREVWRWTGDAYGELGPDEDVDGDGVKTVINLRFPGQYHDAETGLHYNWHRYYVPEEGRYLGSDPIGLQGGLNTYAYANNNPPRWIDPLGLKRVLGRGGDPSKRGSGSARFGIFGALGAGATHFFGEPSSSAQFSPAIGGGFIICSQPKQEAVCETPPPEEKPDDCGIYDPNCDDVWSVGYSGFNRPLVRRDNQGETSATIWMRKPSRLAAGAGRA